MDGHNLPGCDIIAKVQHKKLSNAHPHKRLQLLNSTHLSFFIATPKNRHLQKKLFSVCLLARTSNTDLFSRCRPLHSLTSCLRGVTMYVLHDYASIPNIFHTHNNKTQSLSNKWIEIGFGDDRYKPNIRILIENYDLRTPLILV